MKVGAGGQDLLEWIVGRLRLDLDDELGRRCRLGFEVFGKLDLAIRRTGVREADRAGAVRRVAGGFAKRRHLRDRADGRQLDAARARLEKAIYGAAVELGEPNQGRQAARRGVPGEPQAVRLGQLGVLEIHNDEVETATRRDVENLRRAELDEQPPSAVAGSQHV
jgi:hypothetical protein